MAKIFQKVHRERHHKLCLGEVETLEMPQKEEVFGWLYKMNRILTGRKIIPTQSGLCQSTEVWEHLVHTRTPRAGARSSRGRMELWRGNGRWAPGWGFGWAWASFFRRCHTGFWAEKQMARNVFLKNQSLKEYRKWVNWKTKSDLLKGPAVG